MIIDPYATTITKPYKSDAIRAGVVLAALADRPGGLLFRVSEQHSEVPRFTQPILFELPGNRGTMVAVDLRQFQGGNAFIKEQIALLEHRALLTLYGAREGNLGAFYHPVAEVAFANILAGMISQRFGIDPKLKMQITVVAAAHYYNITHSLENGYSDTDLPMMMQQIVKNFRLPADVVEAVLDKCEYGVDMESFCANVKRVDDTDRTASFSPGLLINSTGGLWFGVNAAETLGVAMEHAPTFCALLYEALGDGSYSRGEMAKRLKYVSSVRQKADTFRKAMRSITSEMEYA